jgi:two-component system, cell cycle sensor histidine kinase and response regulator CckA
MNQSGNTKVLLVEDSAVDARLVKALLEHGGTEAFSVTHVVKLADALRHLVESDIDVVILDLGLPDSMGLETLLRLHSKCARVPIVVLTGTDDEAVGTRAMHEGAQDYIPKSQLQSLLLVRSIRYAMERHRAVLALRESNEALSRMIASAADAIITENLDGIITSWNPAAERLFGYSIEEALGKPTLMLLPPDRTNEEREILGRIMKGEGLEHFESVRIRRDGSPVHVAVTISPIWESQGHIIGASKIARDISGRKQAEDTLRRQASLIDQAYDAVFVWERNGAITFWNRGAQGLYGFSKEEAIGRIVHELLRTSTPKGLEGVLQSLALRGRWEGELEQTRRDGKHIVVESRMVQIAEDDRSYILETNRDVSEMRLLEEQLRQSQKMDAVGRLAGGVAHDFNNLLTVILGSAELLAECTELGKVRVRTEAILRAGQQAANLTRQLLAFSRQQVLVPRVIDLNSQLSEVAGMLVRLVGEDIKIRTSLASNLGRVRIDPSQIEQIVLNLVVNAREAMPQGGQITIETQNIELDEAYTRSHVSVLPGRYVMIAVSDSGVGMDAETQTRIFEPFFTTKRNGTGLGLSTVYGAVQQSGGTIYVYSEPGKGTTFKTYFPRVDEPTESTEAETSSVATPPGTETILLVEDSDSLREVTREFLQMAGYKVMEACDGKDALDVARTHKEPIHLVLTDVVMPGMSGRDLAREVQQIHPETRILFMSGYAAGAIVHHGVLDDGISLLTKPFTRSILTLKVRQTLNS